jgi:hypothetical protein
MHAGRPARAFPSLRPKTGKAILNAIRTTFSYVRASRLARVPMPDLALAATIGRPLRLRQCARRVVRKWRALHTLEATVWWTLALTLAVVLGIVVARF